MNNVKNTINSNISTEYKDQYISHKDPNQKNTKKIIIIVIAVLAVLGIVAAILMPTILKKEKKKEEVLTKESKVVKELFDAFREDDSRVYTNIEALDGDDFKLYYALMNVKESDFEEGTKTKEEYGYVVEAPFEVTDEYYQGMNYQNIGRFFKEEKVEAIYKKMFGKDSKVTHKQLELDGKYYYYYDSNNKIYVIFERILCCEVLEVSEQEIVDVKQNKDNLTIKTKGLDQDGNDKFKIDYKFKKEKSTGNWIFVDRNVEIK